MPPFSPNSGRAFVKKSTLSWLNPLNERAQHDEQDPARQHRGCDREDAEDLLDDAPAAEPVRLDGDVERIERSGDVVIPLSGPLEPHDDELRDQVRRRAR
jgi:hypothetical protein